MRSPARICSRSAGRRRRCSVRCMRRTPRPRRACGSCARPRGAARGPSRPCRCSSGRIADGEHRLAAEHDRRVRDRVEAHRRGRRSRLAERTSRGLSRRFSSSISSRRWPTAATSGLASSTASCLSTQVGTTCHPSRAERRGGARPGQGAVQVARDAGACGPGGSRTRSSSEAARRLAVSSVEPSSATISSRLGDRLLEHRADGVADVRRAVPCPDDRADARRGGRAHGRTVAFATCGRSCMCFLTAAAAARAW